MASEADYTEEIQSPDGEEGEDDDGEEADDSNAENEEGPADSDSDGVVHSDDENDDPAVNGSANNSANASAERGNPDHDDSSGGGIRSPSSGDDDLSRSSREGGTSPAQSPASNRSPAQSPASNRSPAQSPTSDRSGAHSPAQSLSPVQSMSPPSSPPTHHHHQPRSPSCNGDDSTTDAPANEPVKINPPPQPTPIVEKGPLEDQEGELDFEEETPEERRDGAVDEPAMMPVDEQPVVAAPPIKSEPVEVVPVKPKRIPITGPSDADSNRPLVQHRRAKTAVTAPAASASAAAALSSTERQLSAAKEEGEEDDELEEGEEGVSDDGAIGSDGADEGEVEDDDDLEEGEVKDGTVIRKQPNRLLCRFYTRGQCTWGDSCRFLHPGINDKGNYSMFSSPKPLVPNNGPSFTWHAGGVHRTGYTARPYAEPLPPVPVPLPLPPPPVEEPVVESAWERGLRHAKEILKKSSKRKESEPDFEDKRMNLGLSAGGDGSNEYEKENDYYVRSPYDSVAADPYAYGYDEIALDPYERQAQDYWRGGNYENFEVRYTRSDFNYHDRLRERGREPRFHEQRDRERGVVFREREGIRGRRDKFERQRSPERNWREERYVEPQAAPSSTRARGDEWRDPWRRSTSPKRRHPSRSFSSHSSASYSSSRSSGSRSSSYTSRSRSSSGSSASSYSSRSYSHSRSHSKTPVKHKRDPNAPPMSSGIGMHMQKMRQSAQHQQQHHQQQQQQQQHQSQAQPGMDRRLQAPVNKPHGRPPPPQEKQRPPVVSAPPPPPAPPVVDRKKPDRGLPGMPPQRRKPSSSGSESPTSRSRSRAAAKLGAYPVVRKTNKSPTRSRSSRSSSISSLESVSSKSSISSKSSFGSGKTPAQPLPRKVDKRSKDRERQRPVGGMSESNWKGLPRQAGREGSKQDAMQADMRVRSLVNAPRQERTSKDLLKQSGQKPQIKLTLLNKPQDKSASASVPSMFEAPELRANKQKLPPPMPEKDSLKVASKGPLMAGKKRPLPSPVHDSQDTASAGPKVTPARANKSESQSPPASPPSGSGKKSTSSRREELLKQLKAVEDAIARKRSKLS